MSGRGTFRNGPVSHPFQPGDVLFVPAGVRHAFEDFSDDLYVWVVFYGRRAARRRVEPGYGPAGLHGERRWLTKRS